MEVEIAFEAAILGQPFACGQVYEGVGSAGTAVTPRDLRFYVQEVRLRRADDGQEVEVALQADDTWQTADVALVDFEDATGRCADANGGPATHPLVRGTVPEGDYDGLTFVIGVPETFNHADPLQAPAPLAVTSLMWNWLGGYKFFVAELEQQVDATTQPGQGEFHLGSTQCTGTVAAQDIRCDHPNRSEVGFERFDPDADTVLLDLGTLFEATDLTANDVCHAEGPGCDPLMTRLGIDMGTGRADGLQAVFTVKP